MFRSMMCAAALVIFSALPGLANEWVFRYGPDFSAAPAESYSAVTVGRNTMVVGIQSLTDRTIGATVTLDTFTNGPGALESLRAGAPLKLDVLMGGGAERHERVIDKSQYRFREQAGENSVLIVFYLTADDLFAMADAKAVFVWAGSHQHRFGLKNANIALGRLVSLLGGN